MTDVIALNTIRENPGARVKRMRIGRGIGSGKGKTGGRGGKGQTARSGVAIGGFEGGQMPLYRRLPKKGFKNPFRVQYATINTGDLQKAVDSKKIDASQPVDFDTLLKLKLVRNKPDGLKILGNGTLTAKLTINATAATKSALQIVEKAGGILTLSEVKSS
jgi:large subunit ribosomal protein L15